MGEEKPTASDKHPKNAEEPRPAPVARPNPAAMNVLQNSLSEAEIGKRGKP